MLTVKMRVSKDRYLDGVLTGQLHGDLKHFIPMMPTACVDQAFVPRIELGKPSTSKVITKLANAHSGSQL